MAPDDVAASEEAARALVQFLKEAEGRYVIDFPSRVGARPYFRPTEWEEWKMKSLQGPDASVKEATFTDAEMVEEIVNAWSVEVKSAARTPPEVWGTREGGHEPDVTNNLMKARNALDRADMATDDGHFGAVFDRLRQMIESVTRLYIDSGAEGDAEVSNGR